jgi:signal transduction histidine kinase
MVVAVALAAKRKKRRQDMERVVPPDLDEGPVVSAQLLLALARLALRASASASSGLVSIGPALLDRLVAACHADGGALLLVSGLEGGPRGDLTMAPVGDHNLAPDEPARTAHTLALHAMTEGEAWALVAGSRAGEMAAGRIVLDGSLDGSVALRAYPICGHALGTPHTCGDNRCAVLALRWHAAEVEHARSAAELLETVGDAVCAVFVAGVRAAELALRRAEGRADARREADRLKAELLGTVSHELRSPLAAIKGYADTLVRHERQLPAAERREFLHAISQASDRLERLIDQMLEMSQLETGAVRLGRIPLDAEQLARDAMRAAERLAEERAPGRFAFHLRGERGTETPEADGSPIPQIPGDPGRLREVLDRLLENAICYSPDGGEVTVEVRRAPDELACSRLTGSDAVDGTAVQLVVRDTGQGIPEEHLGRVFERFHRVDTRLTREVDGLGLGLAICKHIVELHGGAIWAESEPGAGSAFYLLLPVTLDSSEARHDPSPAASVRLRED